MQMFGDGTESMISAVMSRSVSLGNDDLAFLYAHSRCLPCGLHSEVFTACIECSFHKKLVFFIKIKMKM